MVSPGLALFVCLLFCIFVYWVDSTRDDNVSPAVWLAVLWMMLCSSRSLNYWFSAGYDAPDEAGSPYDRVYLSILMVAGLFVLLRRRLSFADIFSNNIWLFVFYFYLLISTLWSDSTDISFKRWFRTAGDLIMVSVVLTEGRPLEAISKLFRKCFFLHIPLSLVLIRYFPDMGRLQSKGWQPDMWIGVSTHKNVLAQSLFIAGLYFLWDLLKNKNSPCKGQIINIIYLIMIGYLFNGGGHSRSATGFSLFVLSIIIYVFLERYNNNPSSQWKPIMAVVLFSSIVIFLDIVIFDETILTSFASVHGRDATLTGRTDLWKSLIPLGMKHPILGTGYGFFWTEPMAAYLKEIYSWGPGQAHNGYIDMFLSLGIIGVFFFCVLIFVALKGALRQSVVNFEYGTVRLTLLVVAIIHNFTESGFTRPGHMIWFIFLLFAVNLPPILSGNSSNNR